MKEHRFSFETLTYPLWGIYALTLASGVFLAVHYVPAFTQAFPSLQRVNEQVPFGWLIRRLHVGGGTFFLLLALLHLARVFSLGAYKDRCGAVWALEGGLVFCALIAGLTGFFLPLSQEAYWGTASALSSLSAFPFVGGFLADFLRGGKELGGAALSRFFSLHLGLAALMALLLLGHSRLTPSSPAEEKGPGRAWSLFALAAVLALLFALITFKPLWLIDPLREAANPGASPEGIASPWFFLFFQEALSFLGPAYPVLTLVFSLLVLSLFFGLPFLDRNPHRSLLQRPAALAAGSALGLGIVYFTLVGLTAMGYGEKVILPKEGLSPAEARGARVYVQKNCAYCHQVFGRQGRREGPDMAVVVQRGRSPEWVQRFILNARLYQPGTTMPRYDIPLEDLEALSAYLLSLDPKKREIQAINRERFLAYGAAAGSLEGKER